MAITIQSQPELLAASGNRLYFVVHSDKAGYLGFSLTAKIYILGNGTETQLPAMKLYPNGDGRADLEVGKIISNRLKPVFPDLAEKGIAKLEGVTLKFKVVFTESYGGTTNQAESGVITALKGKFSEKQSVTAFVKAGNYLTNGGNIVETVPDGVYYLTALFLTAGSFSVKLKTILEDGKAEFRTIGSVNPAKPYEVYVIPCGLKHLALPKQPDQYSVYVQNSSGTTILKEVTFNVRRMVKKYRSMLYLNVAGGIDTVVVTDQSETMKTERETYRAENLRLSSELTDYTDTFEATTGYISEEAVKLCREVLISDHVYLTHAESLMAINIEKGSFKLFSENEDLQSLNLKYSFADQDYPVLNDDGGGVNPEPDPDPEPDPEPEPEKVMACCPDGVDDYLSVKNQIAISVMIITPSVAGMKCIYTIDMIPGGGFCFAAAMTNTFYLGFMFVGSGLIIQTYYNNKSSVVYQVTSEDYSDRRVTVEFSAENNGTDLLLSLKLNGNDEPLEVLTAPNSYAQSSDFFNLFRSGVPANQGYGESKIISFSIDTVSNGNTQRKVLWNFQGDTTSEKLKNKAGTNNYDLIMNNVADINEFIKETPFKN